MYLFETNLHKVMDYFNNPVIDQCELERTGPQRHSHRTGRWLCVRLGHRNGRILRENAKYVIHNESNNLRLPFNLSTYRENLGIIKTFHDGKTSETRNSK